MALRRTVAKAAKLVESLTIADNKRLEGALRRIESRMRKPKTMEDHKVLILKHLH